MNDLRNYIFHYAYHKFGDKPECLRLKYLGYAALRQSCNETKN